ncbi:hypothetical protein ASG47_19970 [Devosia sp. Leaf420]|uniref:phospholipase D-like domain-containing protein n=1 Tax=Devosia sp. Leaf420 TaxID=1736374 RepID=UPI0007128249|nr:phospholipase D-like domain-containing protein [Devosia sp. Leaf420]KQT50207.1 hypothetical protein ASG47_19970 [Devosia sp. Leaf420]
MLWRDLGDHVETLAESAERSLVLVAPFAKIAIVAGLLRSVPEGVTPQLYTRWRVEDVAAGVTDTRVLDVVEERGGTVWLVDDLHAKAVVADGQRALVGSANLTAAGLGRSRHPNLEIMTAVEDGGAIAPFLLTLRSRARLATLREAAEVEAAAADLRQTMPTMVQPDSEPADEAVEKGIWTPGFRSPDRLFRLYSDPCWWQSAKPHDPALQDLVELGLPGELRESVFNERVRAALLSFSWAQDLDVLLNEPQRFGSVAAIIGRYLPYGNRAAKQAAAQVVIRWLIHFAPDRFAMRTPNYSEILFRP